MTTSEIERPPVRSRRLHHAWFVVIASGLVFLVQSGISGYFLGVFQPFWIEEFSWPQTWLSGAYATIAIAPGFAGVLVGRWTDRYGPRLIILTGVVLAGFGYILLATVHSFPLFCLAIGFTALGRCGMNQVPAAAAIARWFVTKRALAMGLASSGISLAGVVLVPLAAWLIVSYGWRGAAIMLGVGMWVMLLPVVWFAMVSKPADIGLKPYGYSLDGAGKGTAPIRSFTLQAAMKDRRFWLIAAGQMLGTFGVVSVGIHSQKAMIDRGVSIQEAAAAISLMATCALLSRFIYSAIGDHLPPAPLLALSNVFQAIGFAVLALVVPGPMVWIFAVFFGLSLGGNVALSAIILIDLFGVTGYGAILGAISLPAALLAAASPILAAISYDVTGSYSIAFIGFAFATLTGGACYLLAVWSGPHREASEQPLPASENRP